MAAGFANGSRTPSASEETTLGLVTDAGYIERPTFRRGPTSATTR
jgi:hypothetical protein